MTISQRINRIQKLLETDAKLLEWVEKQVLVYQDGGVTVLSASQRNELDLRRDKHVAEESESYSLTEMKQELIDKYGLPS